MRASEEGVGCALPSGRDGRDGIPGQPGRDGIPGIMIIMEIHVFRLSNNNTATLAKNFFRGL